MKLVAILIGMLVFSCKHSVSFRPAANTLLRLHHLQKGCEISRFCTTSQGSEVIAPTPITNKRFWTKNVAHSSSNVDSISTAINVVEEMLRNSASMTYATEVSTLAKGSTEQGLVIIPKFNYLVPIHGGRLQVQHGTELPTGKLVSKERPTQQQQDEASVNPTELIFCGFSSRAEHTMVLAEDKQRPVNETRLKAMEEAMVAVGLGLSGDDLLSAEYAGSIPAKVYRSFVYPRARANTTHPSAESMQREALQKARQVCMGLRQLRADRAAYLRNIDKPMTLGGTAAGTESDDEEDNHSSSSSGASSSSSESKKASIIHPVVLVLDNLRSAYNVGSIFRTAETAGAAEVITCGITAHPPHPKLMKTAMQSVEVVPSRHFDDALLAIDTLKSEGYSIVAMETTSLSKKYTDVKFTGKVALVLGHELTGVDTRIMEKADMVVEIPTYGVKNSLNVGSAASIVLFEILRQWHMNDAAQ